MVFKVFYSWQSDLPNSTNRSFIENALNKAVKSISADDLQLEAVVDRDTADVLGSPEIANTILEKIDQAAIFVCDVSIINHRRKLKVTPNPNALELTTIRRRKPKKRNPRVTPNPNVLIELGYALKSLGSKRIIMVANRAYGTVEDLPFDLRARRVLLYNVLETTADKSTARKALERSLTNSIRAIFQEMQREPVSTKPDLVEETLKAIENKQPNALPLLRRWIAEFHKELQSISLSLKGNLNDETLLESLEQSEQPLLGFSRIVQASAINGTLALLRTLYLSSGFFLENYHTPRGFSGSFSEMDFDFFKFLGHETFVILFAVLIREENWTVIHELLEEKIPVEYSRNGNADIQPFHDISDYVYWLDRRSQRLNPRRVSVHADTLIHRHTEGVLAQVVPAKDFVDADYFLYLKAELASKEEKPQIEWRAWTIIYLDSAPKYITKSFQKKYAKQLASVFDFKTVEELRDALVSKGKGIQEMYRGRSLFFSLRQIDMTKIGME